MKLQKFYILAAAALLISAGSAQAQTTALNGTPNALEALEHDCVSATELGTQVLLLGHGDVVSQSFEACASGIVELAYVKINQVQGAGHIKVSIEDSEGKELSYKKVNLQEGFSELAYFKMNVRVEAAQKYNLVIKSTNARVVLNGKFAPKHKNDLYLNGWKLEGAIAAAIGIKEITRESVVDGPSEAIDDDLFADRATEFQHTFSVFPNPFKDQLTVSFKEDFRGETIITLSDLSGNVLHREVGMNVMKGQSFLINPIYNLRPGAYALRILNNNRVYNQTLMKQ